MKGKWNCHCIKYVLNHWNHLLAPAGNHKGHPKMDSDHQRQPCSAYWPTPTLNGLLVWLRLVWMLKKKKSPQWQRIVLQMGSTSDKPKYQSQKHRVPFSNPANSLFLRAASFSAFFSLPFHSYSRGFIPSVCA